MRKLSFPVAGGICGILALLVTVLGVAGAGTVDLFDDISGSPFREQINDVGAAGCVSGFQDGGFHPRDNATRQQFAYWLNNCGGRLAHNEDLAALDSDDPFTAVNSIRQIAGGQELPTSSNGFVFVNADIVASTTEAADCPCDLTFRIVRINPGGGQFPATFVNHTLPNQAGDSGTVSNMISTSYQYIAGAGQEYTYELRAAVVDASEVTVQFQTQLTAIYVPFGWDGGSQPRPLPAG